MTVRHVMWATIFAGIFMLLAGRVLELADPPDCISTDGHQGQVYVVDTREWVDAGDHSAHEAGQ